MTYAIVKINQRQFRVQEGQTFKVALLSEPLKWEVLLISDGKVSFFDASDLSKGEVKLSVVGESKDRKLRLGRFKSKSRYDKVLGQRTLNTLVKVESIKHAAIEEEVKSEPAKKEVVVKKAVKKSEPKAKVSKEVAASKDVKTEKVSAKKTSKKLQTEAN